MKFIRANLLSRLDLIERRRFWLPRTRLGLRRNALYLRLLTAFHKDIDEHVRRDRDARPEDYRGWTMPPRLDRQPQRYLTRVHRERALDSLLQDVDRLGA